jgi:hypothetical protein
LRGKGVDVTCLQGKDFENAGVAATIEQAYRAKNENIFSILKRTMAGERDMWFPKGDLFCEKLGLRADIRVDPSGKVRQHQSMLLVEYGLGIASGLKQHDPLQGLTETSSPHALVQSCLKFLNIEVDTYTIPLLKVWEAGQLQLGKILITYLAGSLVTDGGLNSSHARHSNIDVTTNNEKCQKALHQIYLEHPWMSENMSKTKAESRRRTALTELIERVRGSSENGAANIRKPVTKEDIIEFFLKKIQEFEEARKTSDSAMEAFERVMEYQEALLTWLEKKPHKT